MSDQIFDVRGVGYLKSFPFMNNGTVGTTTSVPATYLTDNDGNYIIDPATGSPLVVPSLYNPENTIAFFQSAASFGNINAYLVMAEAFPARSYEDLQRSYNGVTDTGYYVPAFKDAASFNLGVATAAAGISFNDTAYYGGLYNYYTGRSFGGPYDLAPGNYENIIAGYNYYYFVYSGLNQNLYTPSSTSNNNFDASPFSNARQVELTPSSLNAYDFGADLNYAFLTGTVYSAKLSPLTNDAGPTYDWNALTNFTNIGSLPSFDANPFVNGGSAGSANGTAPSYYTGVPEGTGTTQTPSDDEIIQSQQGIKDNFLGWTLRIH